MSHHSSRQLTEDSGSGYGEVAATLVSEGLGVWGHIMQMPRRQT